MFAFVVAIIFLIVGLFMLVFAGPIAEGVTDSVDGDGRVKRGSDGKIRSARRGFRTAGICVIVLAIFIAVIPMIKIVDPGNVGVPVAFGKTGSPMKSGLHITAPWVSVKSMSTRTEQYTMSIAPAEGAVQGDDSIEALSSDGASLKMDITIWYRLDAGSATSVFKKIGKDYEQKIIRPAIRTVVRDETRKYAAVDAFSTRRDELQQGIQDGMISLVGSVEGASGVIIETVNLRNIALPDSVRSAIEAKLTAEQEAQAMQYKLQRETQLAQQRVIEAQGLADSQKIIDSSLTPSYLQWKYITTIGELVDSPNNTVIILPFDQNLTPMINLPASSGSTVVTPPTTDQSTTPAE